MVTYRDLDIYNITRSLKDKEVFEDFIRRYEELGAKIMAFTKSVERGHLTKRQE